MSRLGKWISENLIRYKVVPKANDVNKLPVADAKNSLVYNLESEDSESTSLDIAAINECRTLSENRDAMYQAYDSMKEDTIISAALELYADDATQYDSQGKVIWIESDDPNITKAGNRLLTSLEIPTKAWSHIYSLCLYGDLYLETFRKEIGKDDERDQINKSKIGDLSIHKSKINSKLVERVETVYNPAEIFDLTKRGQTVGFVKIPQTDKSDVTETFTYKVRSTEVYEPMRFVHISLGQQITRFPEKVVLMTEDDPEDPEKNQYIVKRGKSILHDIYKIHQELSLMEDALLLNRVTRSSIIRLLQVEVGDMPKTEVSRLLKRVKNLIEHHVVMDKGSGEYKSVPNPGPMDNILYIPTRNGKGSINTNIIGGDVDVKSIADLDYFRNKEFGGLKIPKQFLGYSSEEGLGAGQSLAKISSRYARTIKRIQNSYAQGVKNLLNYFFMDRGLDYVNKFDVKMTSPSTTEDAERDESLSSKMDIIDKISQILTNAGYPAEVNQTMVEFLLSTFVNQSDLVDKIKKAKENIPPEPSPEEEEPKPSGFSSTTPGSEKSPEENPTPPEEGSPEQSEEPGESGQENKGDFGPSGNAGFGNFEKAGEGY